MLTPLALALTTAQIAWSAEIGDAGLVDVLPVSAIVADGSAHRLHLIALGPDGRPLSDVKGTVRASVGKAGALEHVGEGLHAFDYTPPEVSGPQEVRLTVRARSGGRRFTAERTVEVLPARRGRIGVQATADALVLGSDAQTTLSFTATDAAGRPLDADPVATASVGRIEALTALGGGRYSARYVPPESGDPGFAVVTVVDRRAPDAVTGHLAIPLHARVVRTVEAPSGAAVLLRVGEREFGPVIVPDGADRVDVPVVLPPGVGALEQVVVVDGEPDEQTVPLDLPEPRRVALFPLPDTLPAHGSVAVRAIALTPSGAPDPGAAVSVSATAGEVGSVVHEGGGVFRAALSLPDGRSAVPATVVASVSDDPRQTASRDVELVPHGDDAPAPGEGPVVRLVLVPESDRVDAGARREVHLLALDAHGLGVPDVPVTLGADRGAVPEQVTTDASGRATLAYTADTTTGLVTLAARAGDARGAATLLQGVAAPGLALPGADPVEDLWRARLRGDGSAATATVAAPPPTAPGPEPDPEARIARVEVDVEPEQVAPGQTIMIHARATASDGAPVPGQPLELLASVGTFGKLSDLGLGDYVVGLTVPDDAADVVKITVASPDGAASAFVKVPVVPSPPAEARAAGPAPEADPFTKVRLSWVGTSYRYEQRPTGGGPLLPEIVSIGGALGEGAAFPQGLELGVVSFPTALPYLGFSALARTSGYGVRSDAFDDVARDWLHHLELDVAGRYPFGVGESGFYAGLRLGFRYDDWVYYTGAVDDGSIGYEMLGVPGLGIAAEIGAKVGGIDVHAAIQEQLAYFSAPYATGVDLRLSYAVTPELSAEVGFASLTRRITLAGEIDGAEYGTLSDGQLLGTVGIGHTF